MEQRARDRDQKDERSDGTEKRRKKQRVSKKKEEEAGRQGGRERQRGGIKGSRSIIISKNYAPNLTEAPAGSHSEAPMKSKQHPYSE